jgi:hypothetical protein
MMPYHYAFAQDGTPSLVFERERIVRRDAGFRFSGAVHEAMEVSGHVIHEDIVIRHTGEHRERSSARNLDIYEKWITSGKALKSRDWYYYARELASAGKTEEAEKVFETVYTKKKMFHKIVYKNDILQTINYDTYKNSYVKVVLTDDYNEGKLNVFLSMLDEKAHPYSIQTIDIREQKETLMEEISADDVDNPIEIMMNTITSKVDDEEMCQLVKNLTYEIYQSAMDSINV